MKLTPLLLLSLYAYSPLSAATYVEPKLGDKTLLKLDRIPLDVQTLESLSTMLSEIAETQDADDAQQLRTAGKLLATALLLDHDNPTASAANSLFLTKSGVKESDWAALYEKSKRLWSTVDFLTQQKDNDQAQKLSFYIKDAMLSISPNHVQLQGFSAPENLWDGIVATAEEFEFAPEAPLVNNDRITHTELKKTAEELEPSPVKDSWHLKNLEIFTPTIIRKGQHAFHPRTHPRFRSNQKNIREISPVILSIKSTGDTFRISSVSVRKSKDPYAGISDHISKILRKEWPDFSPAKVKIKKSFNQNDYSFSAAAIAIALDASLSNKQALHPDLIVATNINDNAEFTETATFWNYLKKSISKIRGKRILVSPQSEKALSQLLVLGQPEFFLENEVLAVKNLKQARTFSGSIDDPSVAKASLAFRVIKKGIQDKPLGSMLSKSSVRQRLHEVLQLYPGHLSAKMLLLQASKKRPREFTSKYFKLEMKDILIEEVGFLGGEKSDKNNNRNKRFAGNSKTLKEKLNKLKDLSARNDLNLYEKGIKLSSSLRILERSSVAYEKDRFEDIAPNIGNRHYVPSTRKLELYKKNAVETRALYKSLLAELSQ